MYPNSPFITENKILGSFYFATVDRGRKYQQAGKVLNYTHSGQDTELEELIGVVKGSEIYMVSISRTNAQLRAKCSCPVGSQCKHAVALAFEFMSAMNRLGEFSAQEQKKSKFDSWLEESNQLTGGKFVTDATEEAVRDDDKIWYLLKIDASGSLCVLFYRRKKLKSGALGRGAKIKLSTLDGISEGYNFSSTYSDLTLSNEDKYIINLFDLSYGEYGYECRLVNSQMILGLKSAIETGRCHYSTFNSPAFIFNETAQDLDFKWKKTKEGYSLSLKLNNEDFMFIPEGHPIFCFTQASLSASYLSVAYTGLLIDRLLDLPKLSEDEVFKLVEWMGLQSIHIPLPEKLALEKIEAPCVPHLTIRHNGAVFFANYHFQYGDVDIEFRTLPAEPQSILVFDDKRVLLQRDLTKEREANDLVFNVAKLTERLTLQVEGDKKSLVNSNNYFWAHFTNDIAPRFNELGGEISIETDLPFPQIIDAEDLQGSLEEDEYSDWFQLGLSIEIEGKQVDLVPLLLEAFKEIDDINDLPEKIVLRVNDDFVRFSKEQLSPIIKILQELMDDKGRIGKHHASVINDIPFIDEWSGGKKIQEIAHKLSNFTGLESVSLPKNLNAELRDYQKTGLDWLAFLQEYGFAGILADDMGLGKTIQTLAMMQRQFELGLLTKPMIVICPTSLVGNWRSEAEKFTPDLNVLVLHGSKRKEEFEKIAESHLIITTYPLVFRDIEVLKEHHFQWIVLDEAQAIKNPSAKMTQSVKKLKGQNKLCLTGTPMQNHLGELWSQFDFLMPGYLSTHKGFNDLYRKQIEGGDEYAQQWLNKRINPFLLRRTKDQVATELPKKTEIIQHIELPKKQRVLYETIRVTMEKKVRDLLKTKGVAKSQIEFLDALLKLRQACCHTDLVKLESAQKIHESAKLDFLLDTIPEMVEEGRKILIFSQFTSMLAIIEKALNKAKIKTTKLTGQTRKREEVINEFKSGKVDVFLISLKAGGVGLNLTEADTVIHFDPWWNPAAENQATDRAHRIGQDKPVFVYKLVTENTIEERVLELQKKKQAMADSVYGSKAQKEQASLSKMDANQLLSLFE